MPWRQPLFCLQRGYFCALLMEAWKFVHEKGILCTELFLAVIVCARKGCFLHRVDGGVEVCARKGYSVHRVVPYGNSLCTKWVFSAQSCWGCLVIGGGPGGCRKWLFLHILHSTPLKICLFPGGPLRRSRLKPAFRRACFTVPLLQ